MLLRHTCLFIFFFLSFWVQAQQMKPQGLSSDKRLSQFVVDHWDNEKGLPYNNVNHVTQSSDGYLWLSTFDGLIRFDGQKFDVLNKETDELILTNGFYKAFASSSGRLWMGSQGSGLLYLEGGQLYNYDSSFLKPISSLYEDQNGVVWIGTINSGGYKIVDDKIEPIACEDLNKAAIRDIFRDAQGSIWMASEGHGVVKIDKKGRCARISTSDGLPNDRVVALEADIAKNIVWVGTTAGLAYIENREVAVIEEFAGESITDLLHDEYGSLWVGTTTGLARRSPSGHVEWLEGGSVLNQKYIKAIRFDEESNLWVATKGAGLFKIWDGKFVNYNKDYGLSSNAINYICQVGENEFWIASDKGTVDVLKEDTVSQLSLPKALQNTRIKDIYRDSKNRVWVATYKGVLVVDEEGEQSVLTRESGLPGNRARIVIEDKAGNIWIGTRAGGLCKIDGATGAYSVYNTDNGLSSNFVMCLAEGPSGNIWVGTNGGGLDKIGIDNTISVYDERHGFQGSIIFSILPDEDKVWVASNGGVSYVESGQFVNFARKGGLPSLTPFDIEKDKNDRFWIPTSDGVLSFSKQGLLDYEAGNANEFTYKVYNGNDGMFTKECTGAAKSSQSSDGRIWFPTINGASAIDPASVLVNEMAPKMAIQAFYVNGIRQDLTKEIKIPAGKSRFEIDYAALSFIASSEIQFKYKLDDDDEWVDAKNKRNAVYTNLPHGKHIFTVKSCNSDGIWNEGGVTLEFYIAPYFYETIWFYVISAFGVLVLIYIVYLIRIGQVTARNQELERQVMDRTAEINLQKEEISAQRDQIALSLNNVQTVTTIGKEVTNILTVEELVASVYKHINKLMKADGFGIGLYSQELNHLDFRGYIENNEVLPSYADDLSNPNQLSVHCFTRQERIFANHPQEYMDYLPSFEWAEHGELPKSIIYLPLNIDDRRLGVITVQSFKEEAYTSSDIAFLEALGAYICIALDNSKAYEVIKDKNKAITDSLRYAKTIQDAVLPNQDRLSTLFSDYFIVYKPKDIVSGDFYWVAHAEDGRVFLAVADCTGHGVPGAFMSMIGTELLNEIFNVEGIREPDKMLRRLDVLIQQSFKTKGNREYRWYGCGNLFDCSI